MPPSVFFYTFGGLESGRPLLEEILLMLHSKSDAVDLLAAVENAPEIMHVEAAAATQCVKNCDGDGIGPRIAAQCIKAPALVTSCVDTEKVITQCEVQLCDRVAAQCDLLQP